MQLADFHIHIAKAVASVWQKGGIRLMQVGRLRWCGTRLLLGYPVV